MNRCVAILLILLCLFSCRTEKPTKEEIIQYVTTSPLKFSEECIITRNIIDDHRNMEGKPSKAIIPVKALVKTSVNLADIQGIKMDEKEQTVHLFLPKPVIRISYPEMENTHAIYCSDVTRSTFFESDLASYRFRTKDLIIQSIIESDMATNIQHTAALAIANMMMQQPKFRNMSYKIEVVKYGPDDISNFIIQ